MSFQFDATNPNDLLNQRFRDHFSRQDSTLCNLLNVLEKPLLRFLKSLLEHQEHASTNVESIEKEILNALPRILTGDIQVDRPHMIPSTRTRQFLDKCLEYTSYFFELDQRQLPPVQQVSILLLQMDKALEQYAQVAFKMRFAQLAWYRSYKEFAMARGWTLYAHFDSFDALLPRLEIVGFEEFVQIIKPDADQLAKDRMHRLTLAGFRYDYLTRDEQMYPDSDGNDHYLFTLPLTIGNHVWEQDLQDIELQQTRIYLHRLGWKDITLSFPGLHNLARNVTQHYIAMITSTWMSPPIPWDIKRSAAEIAYTTTTNRLPPNTFMQSPRSPNQPRLTNADVTSATESHQQPPLQENTLKKAMMYTQAPSYIAEYDQPRGLTTAKMPHSPASVPILASSVVYQKGSGPLAIEPPPKTRKVIGDHTSIRSIPGHDQQAGVSHIWQSQARQTAVIRYIPTIEQQPQVGPSTFSNGPATSVVASSQPWPRAAGQLSKGRRPLKTILSKKQDTSRAVTNPDLLATTAPSQAQGQRLPPGRAGLYPSPKSSRNTSSLSNTQKPIDQGLTKLERSKLSQPQQQSMSYEAAHSPTVSEWQQTDPAVTTETSPLPSNYTEQQQPRTIQHTSDAQMGPYPRTPRVAQIVPRSPGLSRLQRPPQPLTSFQQQKNQADGAAYINKCHGVSPTQGQEQEHSPSLDPVNPYSTNEPKAQTPGQQSSASDTPLEPVDDTIAQTEKGERSAPASPLPETGEREAPRKSHVGTTKYRLPARGSQEEPIHMIDSESDDDGDDESEYEEGGEETRKRKKLRR